MSLSLQELLTDRPVITDGAWATQLQERGLPLGSCPDAWNLDHPDRVEQLARDYVEAGSRVILTNTFGANRISLERHGLADRVVEINQTGVEISRRAGGTRGSGSGRAYVFASMGSTGRMLAAGEISEEALHAVFAEQAHALAGCPLGVAADALVIETMTDLAEAKVAVSAARETGLPVVACMVFGRTRAGYRTMMGNTPEQAAEALARVGASAMGANCGEGAASFAGLCERLRAASDLPLWIKPNAGLPRFDAGRALYDTTPEEFAAQAQALVSLGADFIGGCCGTGPAFIRALVRALGR